MSNIKPGDLIEWVYRHNKKIVVEDEHLLSSVEDEWVPIGRELTHLCVSCDEKTYAWLNEKGLFLASVGDSSYGTPDPGAEGVVPRVRG
jgi:hypothetical protein